MSQVSFTKKNTKANEMETTQLLNNDEAQGIENNNMKPEP